MNTTGAALQFQLKMGLTRSPDFTSFARGGQEPETHDRLVNGRYFSSVLYGQTSPE